MLDFQNIFRHKIFIFIITLCSIIYVFSYLILPFSTADTTFYALIGRSLLQNHMLPYQYVFDHKPFGVYVLYGAWDMLTAPLLVGKFTVLALLSCSVFASIARRIWGTPWLWVFATLALLGAPFEILTGNTETILITTELTVIWLTRKGTLVTIWQTGYILLLAAGFTFALTVNINYLEGICLFLPICFLLLTSIRPILNIALFTMGTCGGLAALFSPYLIQGHHALADYFIQQHEFLQAYSANISKRVKSTLLLTVYLALFGPILFKWFKQKSILKTAPTPDITLLTLWFLSSIPAALLSGHLLNHYSILWIGPIAVIFSILVKKHTNFSIIFFVPLLAFQIYAISESIHKNIKEYFNLKQINYSYISNLTKNQKILNIRAQQSHFYMAHLLSFDKYLFHNHIDIMYRKNAGQHYLQDLSQHPAFVISPYKGCATGAVEQSVCAYIQEYYQLAYKIRVGKAGSKKFNRLSFELYKLKN